MRHRRAGAQLDLAARLAFWMIGTLGLRFAGSCRLRQGTA
jgi:hypothetical protein